MSRELPTLLAISDVAGWLSIPTGRIARLVRSGDIPHLRLPGGEVAFDPVDLAEWVKKFKVTNPGAAGCDCKPAGEPVGAGA